MNFDYVIYSLEDDENISHIINLALSKNGYSVKSFYNYKDFLEAFNNQKPNMVLLDLMLPDVTGEQVLQNIRSDSSNDDIQVIILSAKNLTINKIDGLDLGADDYISKPFDVLELISRVNARSRRFLKKKNEDIKIRNVTINLKKREVKLNDELLKFTNSEFTIIECLVKHLNEITRREELLDALWGKEGGYETRVLDVRVTSIRKKLGSQNADLIETIYGIGFKLKNE